jgi:hypothetical protein
MALKVEQQDPWEVEETDTFGGEANYCWVNRWSLPGGLTHKQLVRRAKKLAGWSGQRCRVEDCGDMIRIDPIGRDAPCRVIFIQYQY